MPPPRKGESRQAYISRFVSDDAMQKKFPDQKQRLAVAYSYWKKKPKSNNLNQARIKALS